MKKDYTGKSVVIIGASGGLGSGFVKAFADKGARILLVGRNEEKLKWIAEKTNRDLTIAIADITKVQSLTNLVGIIKDWSDSIDIIVNASGYDVRKSLDEHSYEEIENTLDINLLGVILVTKMLLPYMNKQAENMIVHIGGFTDGRMAFPYYSVDVSSRAGVFTFIEAVNRELELEGSKTRISFFCPSPADTDAERPFHPLWRKMGIQIVSVESVSEALLRVIEKRKKVSIMGGFATVLFAKLNSIMPTLADKIIMRNYGKMLKEFLYDKQKEYIQKQESNRNSLLNKIAIILIILSFVLYGLIFIVPFLPFTIIQKALIVPGLVASGEITWWIGVAIVGKKVISKYKKYLNPCNWFCCEKTS